MDYGRLSSFRPITLYYAFLSSFCPNTIAIVLDKNLQIFV